MLEARQVVEYCRKMLTVVQVRVAFEGVQVLTTIHLNAEKI